MSWPEIAPFLMLFCSTLSNEFDDLDGWRSVPKEKQSRNQSPSAENKHLQDALATSISKEASQYSTDNTFVHGTYQNLLKRRRSPQG